MIELTVVSVYLSTLCSGRMFEFEYKNICMKYKLIDVSLLIEKRAAVTYQTNNLHVGDIRILSHKKFIFVL